MKFHKCFSIILMIICFDSFAQNETNHWYFGENAGMNFSNGDFSVSTNGNMITPAGCSSISDNDGDLLLYTNGQTIWNKNHQIMENGDELFGDIEGVQTSIIIPKPNDESTYYVFYIREFNVNSPLTISRGVYYSEVKFTAANPLGIVTTKNERIANTTSARIGATYHYQSNSYRLICITNLNPPAFGQPPVPNNLIFRVFDISQNGINLNPILWTIEQEFISIGAMKISPDNKYIAIADSTNNKVYFFKFNNNDVTFEYYYTMPTIPALGLFINSYGIEFSQDSKMFYYTGNDLIVQFPFTSIEDITPGEYYLINQPNAASIQLARNGKIYVTTGDSENLNSKISVINKPEKVGVECEFQSEAINLITGNSTKGLPIFVSTFLRNRIISSEDDCLGTTFNFKLDSYAPIYSVVWDFGDGTTSTDFEPSHTFLTSGTKKVQALIYTNNKYMTLYKNIVVYPLPQFGANNILTQCDENGDGYSVFNLENISDLLVFSNLDFQYTFYTTLSDATNDVNAIQNQQNFTNISNPQELFAKIVSHKGCVSINSFFVESSQTPIPPISTMYVCENSDNNLENNEGTFNLSVKEQEIINLLNVPAGFTINFYANLLDAQTKLNPLDRYYTSVSTIIWIRIEDENYNCFGVVPFTAIVNSEIELEIEEVYTICEFDDSPITLDGGNNTTWQWKKRLTSELLSSNRFFELNQLGNYTITVTKIENGITCTESKNFKVVKAEVPILDKVETNDDGSISVSIKGISTYTYSLDGINFFGSGTKHTFTNLEPGIYTIFVKDNSGCETIISKDIFLFGYPKFFTPNEDGINDFWKIYGISKENFLKLEITIYNRYGRLLHVMNLKQNQFGWDGVFNKEKLPASDYWYHMKLIDLKNNIRIKKGHFSLIR